MGRGMVGCLRSEYMVVTLGMRNVHVAPNHCSDAFYLRSSTCSIFHFILIGMKAKQGGAKSEGEIFAPSAWTFEFHLSEDCSCCIA